MDKQERWVLRIPSNREGDRFLAQIRKYLNTDTYKLSKHYTGPRPKGTSPYSTTKENATSVRLYVDSKVPNNQLPMWVSVNQENANLKMRLDYAKNELAKLKAFNPLTLENLLDWRKHE